MGSRSISLRWKVAAAVCLLLVAMAGLIAVAVVRYLRVHLLEEAEKRAAGLAQTLAVSARDPLLEADRLRLGPVIQSIMQDPDAVYAYVLDHEGSVAFHSDAQYIGAAEAPPPLAARGRLLAVAADVVVESTVVGKACVGLSTGFVDGAVRETARGLLLRLGLGTLLGLGGVVLLTDYHLRRLARLEQAVARLGAGDLTARAEVSGGDEVARLASDFNHMVDQLEEARHEIEQGVYETVTALASTIEVNDAYTRGHCERVARGTAAVARRLGIDAAGLRETSLAAMLHDIGKIGVATHILSKDGRLTDEESRQMQRHAALGARVLGSVSFLSDVARFVRSHHEDWDGGGYPDGLEGVDIPLASRIIHVVDAWDAMTSSRPYRTALPLDEARRRLIGSRGSQFDPRIVDVFLALEAEGTIGAIRREIDGQAPASQEQEPAW